MPSLKKIKGRYFAIFRRSVEGERQETSVALKHTQKSLAEKLYRDLLRDLADRRFDPFSARSYEEQVGLRARHVTIPDAASQFLDDRRARGARPATIRAYDLKLRQLADRTPPGVSVAELTAADLRAYVHDDLAAPTSQKGRYGHLAVFFGWCVERGLVVADPLKGVKRPQVERALPVYVKPEDLSRLISAIDADTTLGMAGGHVRTGENVWLRDVVEVAAYTGLRLGELVAARWSWVDLSEGSESIHITHSHGFKTKGNSERVVPLFGPALTAVRRLAAAREERAEYGDDKLFQGPRGGGIDGGRTSKRFKHYVRLARLDGRLHFHSLRHACASHLVQAGVSLQTVQAVLGHSSISVTEIYAHLSPQAVRREMARAHG